MARKKNTSTKVDKNLTSDLDVQGVSEDAIDVEKFESELDVAMDSTDDISDVGEAEHIEKKKSGMRPSTGMLALLLAGVAGIFASPHLAPYMPNSIAKYLEAGDSGNSQALLDGIAQLDQRISGVETGLDGIASQDFAGQISALKTAMDNAPTTSSGDGADFGAFQVELDALKAQNAELSSAIENKLTSTVADAQEQVATAQKVEHNAAVTVALTQLKMSALNGRGIADDLQRLREAGVDVPSSLSEMSSGVDSIAALEEGFGDFAIKAIRASVVASSGDQGGFFADMKSSLSAQFVGRSTTPQEGVTPDAILSRSEDHLRNGSLEQSILELSALPSEAMAEMTPWIERAESRLNLIAAIDALENSAAGN